MNSILPPFDVVIRGGKVYDGSGAPGIDADIAFQGDRIALVGSVGGRGAIEVDATARVVAPGFIDVHTHDDFAVLVRPDVSFKTLQGVTTVIVGNCGTGVVPFEVGLERFRRYYPDAAPPPWNGFAEYMSRVAEAGPAPNVAVLVGHGSLRRGAIGVEARAPSKSEARAMRGWLEEGLQAGAVGMSTGLVYEPGCYAGTEEIVDLAIVMQGTGAVYTTHMRNEAAGLLESVAEAIKVGEQGGVPVQISHHKASGRANWGRVRESLALIDHARACGVDVTADQYPYTAASTSFYAVAQSGALTGDHRSGLGDVAPEGVLIASAPGHSDYEGATLAQLLERWDLPVEQGIARLLDEEGEHAFVVLFTMDEDDVRTVLAHPTTMIGSDGLDTAGGKPHPRLYGTFPRVLGRYVRETAVLDMATAVHRMTGMPALKFGLEGRGQLRTGAFADVVILDPARIEDRASYEEPRRPPIGITDVFVNGRAVVRNGRQTDARPGRVVQRSRT